MKRCKWTKRDILALKKVYKIYSYRNKYPEWLLERHSKWSCYRQATKLNIAKGIRNPGLDLRKISKTDKSYFAGIIDGEGWISFNENKKKTNPFIGIANTDKGLLDWIQKRFTTGNLNLIKRKGTEFSKTQKNLRQKDVYQLGFHGVKNVYDILRAIEIYLVIKKDKSVKARQFLKQKYDL